MALTLITSPDTLSPVYSEIPIRLSSSTSASNYKYVFDTYTVDQLTGLGTFRSRNKLTQRPDGTVLFSPAEILQNYLSYNISPYTSGFTESHDSIVFYKVLLGEEYTISQTFTAAFSGANGYVGFSSSTVNGFINGDLITIDKDNKAYNPQYDGVHTINSILTTSAFTIDVLYGTSTTSAETGSITSKLTIGTNPQVSGKTGINFARQYNERTKNYYNTYVSTTGQTGDWLTDYTNTINIGIEEVYTLGLIDDSSYVMDNYYINTYNTSGALIGIYSGASTTQINNYRRKDFRCGTYNLARTYSFNYVSGSFQYIYTPQVSYYDVFAYNSSNLFAEYSRRFLVQSNCTPFTHYRLAFLNRKGAFDYFTFTLASRKITNVNRSEYRKVLDWNYDVGDRGRTIYNIDVVTEYRLLSDFIDEYTYNYIEQLLASPEIYICNNDTTDLTPVIMISKQWESKTERQDRLIQGEVIIQLSNDINIQRG